MGAVQDSAPRHPGTPTANTAPAPTPGVEHADEESPPCVHPSNTHSFQQSASPTEAAREVTLYRMWQPDEAAPREAAPPEAEVSATAEDPQEQQGASPRRMSSRIMGGARSLLVDDVLDEEDERDRAKAKHGHVRKKKGCFTGVFIPTCENMWGVLIFLRFFFIVGHAGVGQALLAVVLSFCCAFCTTSSMSATISSGGIVSKGGPYYMISRALGPCVGASVGIMYWLAFTILAVLECLGAVESFLMALPQAQFTFCQQAYGSALMFTVAFAVYGGINIVTKLSIIFAAVVFFTLFMYYFGLATAPHHHAALASPLITGLSFETFKDNWHSHYGPGVNFGYVLGVFFPCFTGILSGANRAEILQDPPKSIKQGTFGAIIFSLLMYSSFMVLWGMVADHAYLQGMAPDVAGSHAAHVGGGRRLGGGGSSGAQVIQEIVWNPFPNAAIIGIIISSTSQALQCMVVAPRLMQSIAKDDILGILKPLAPLRRGEPKRALLATYIVAALLVLIGKLDLVAPLLSMCFLVAYAFMNFSCFALTWLRSPAWRPKGIHQKRWRLWYIGTAFVGFGTCIAIMFIIDPWWAFAAIIIGLLLYLYINWKVEARGWGSALDGIRHQFALTALIQLDASQQHAVNWRPQVLILYRLQQTEDVRQDHGILGFYSHLRKGKGFCIVACVLEANPHDEAAHQKAHVEKGVIQKFMREENISGFAEVVVAPSWAEGTNYIIQLSGLGGLSPNTVLLDWPEQWQRQPGLANEFVGVLRTALAKEKAVLAIRGLQDLPSETVYGTIDIWWMIHDGGFLILLSWLLVQHKTWRQCHLRVFTITEGVSEEQAQAAARQLAKTLRQHRLFDVDVEVILADDEMIEPYTYDWTLRVEDRHRFLDQLQNREKMDMRRMQALPLAIDDLFMEAEESSRVPAEAALQEGLADEDQCHIVVSDVRTGRSTGHRVAAAPGRARPTQRQRAEDRATTAHLQVSQASSSSTAIRARSPGIAGPREVSNLPQAVTGQSFAPRAPGTSPSARPSGRMQESDLEAGGYASWRPVPDHESAPTQLSIRSVRSVRSSGSVGRSGLSGSATLPSGFSRLEALFQRQDDSTMRSTSADPEATRSRRPSSSAAADGSQEREAPSEFAGPASTMTEVESFKKLNQIIHSRSKRAQLVVMNLPDLRCDEPEEVTKFMSYCDTLTAGLDRVLFVHASGHEIFDLSS